MDGVGGGSYGDKKTRYNISSCMHYYTERNLVIYARKSYGRGI